jgi:hypothetical protein
MAREIKELLTIKLQLWPERRQVLLGKPERELVVARRNRRMRGENVG